MKELLRCLFLTRDQRFVLEEPLDELPPGEYIRRTHIPAPGPVLPLGILALSFAWYAVFVGLILLSLRGRPLVDTWGPAGILALNAAARGGLKIRERIAMQADWPTPVGRQRGPVRIASGCAGLAFGFTAGWWIVSKAPAIAPGYMLVGAGTLAVTEAVRNVMLIGGRREIRHFKLEEHQVWLKA